MYGHCQVMSSMAMGGGNVVSPETLFSSPIQNPNFNFMPTHHQLPFQPFSSILSPPKEENGVLKMMKGKEDQMMESGSGSEQIEEKSGNEQEADNQLQPPKKKRYHRHTAHQIQEMENMFKECPHPDDKQRMKLSQELGLKPRQVKFWFQNRRTQMKAQQDRSDNAMLRAENENLKNENYRLQAALSNIMCPNCKGPAMIADIGLDEQHLRLENARLREELERVFCLNSQYTSGQQIQTMAPGAPLMPAFNLDLDMNIYPRHFQEYPMTSSAEMIPMPLLPPHVPSHYPASAGSWGGVLSDDEKSLAVELAVSSVAELIKMCRAGEPLWSRNNENGKEVLNVEEHARIFPPWPLNLKQQPSDQCRTEATRDSVVVIMNSINLVDAFLDANKWMELFPSIVSRAKTVQVISADPSGQANGSLQLMYAELQVVSPLVPTRETHFLRYCQQNEEEGSWAIVDFPIDSFHDNLQSSFPRYKRWPSGCLIQDMPNGYSRVTWIEHAEIEEKPVHQIFSHYVYSGMAFGAQRWLAVLQRQCERVASLMARNISDLGVIPSPEARKNMMNLAQRMIRTFCVSMSTSNGQSWTAISDSPDDTVRITTRKVTEPGQPIGVILTAVSTTWLPYSHYRVFELLRDERRRVQPPALCQQLDVLTNGNSLHEVAHIANGSHPGNCISLLRINVSSNSSQNIEIMLQESCTDESGSLVVYATMDVDGIQLAMSGEDPSCIPLLPLGFVIVPVQPIESSAATAVDHGTSSPDQNQENRIMNSGCLLTVGFQVLASTSPSAKLNLASVTAMNNHLCNSVQQIISALGSSNICTTVTTDNVSVGVTSGGSDHPTTPQ
ncbi:homeobox-leucine zipper protein HDG5 isoform X1 [Pyrus x bretschneideri]|uniref:homeobox-leucine zipper protein HDG5 isoform X1 n=2 Tax=Pyrus x bretschneideri TaxID=225117 RepID=UPI00202FE45E|nr:homeobox-leucine zipper protein HDG5 isoform X1 [Pyrus x bretschneideri]XP_009373478.2 homeobox-leucine zipper protein HDG5 isoform X1 [Pyrus x bretschneideri]XP_048434545.1 homeobox-leucine zipper protein HDG5 isoform X1 [Pyrus x bretschneideri]XP_048434546.1 homeobox-leucine zipper protein HDG5 isoform X1 [Pyrus x bretschneideri]XP_048434547.1 homeobox-leucine zipper protein HDG5 isoform X1 [Pyrus x bretschneideri]XP_048434548.1 homeobox-leucine zipper protein HDG5 isoform X1 [Pyrus x bre